ncbi:hypothetical protein J2772_000037 [Chryseobacterium jejuense]|nr:hypothetical protein [Chryseobacterium jejuense]
MLNKEGETYCPQSRTGGKQWLGKTNSPNNLFDFITQTSLTSLQ